MLRRTVVTLLCAGILALGSGCAYVNVRTPYDDNLDNTELGTKVGKASNYGLLWVIAWGDGSYAAAARDGDIKVMKHADREIVEYLMGLYVRHTIIVYGD